LMKGIDLNGRGLLAVNVKDKVAWDIMSDYAEGKKVKEVRAVETRNLVKQRVAQ